MHRRVQHHLNDNGKDLLAPHFVGPMWEHVTRDDIRKSQGHAPRFRHSNVTSINPNSLFFVSYLSMQWMNILFTYG